MKAGRGETRRTVPLHIIHQQYPDLCKVMPAMHNLTGSDIASKIGIKKKFN